MRNFIVHSNESARRKSGRLGLEQVHCKIYLITYISAVIFVLSLEDKYIVY